MLHALVFEKFAAKIQENNFFKKLPFATSCDLFAAK